MLGPFDLELIAKSLPELFSGLVVTLQLTVLTVIGGIILSIPLGVLRTSERRWVSGPIWAYTYFFRGTPMLIQLFLIYYGLAQFKAVRSSGLWFILREGYWCCLLAFTLNTAAYTIEIVAGALRNVPLGDIEAMADALTEDGHDEAAHSVNVAYIEACALDLDGGNDT